MVGKSIENRSRIVARANTRQRGKAEGESRRNFNDSHLIMQNVDGIKK